MRNVLAILFLFAAGVAAQQPSGEAVKKDLKQFQGKWEAVYGQGFDGKPLEDFELKATSLDVNGDKFVMKTGSLTIEGTFKIDPTQKTKTIDVYNKDSNDKPLILGIYQIKGDTRTSCFAEPNKDRPTAITKKKGFMVLEWRKVP